MSNVPVKVPVGSTVETGTETRLEPLLGRPLESPLDGTQEIFVLEGFRQIIVGSDVQALDAFIHFSASRQKQHWRRVPVLPPVPQQAQPVPSRQHDPLPV